VGVGRAGKDHRHIFNAPGPGFFLKRLSPKCGGIKFENDGR
jgi:hypothetical protein